MTSTYTMPTHRTMRARILRTYDASTPDQRAMGATWYATARKVVDALAADFGSTAHAAAIVSHLSPRLPWARNIIAADYLARTGERLPGVMSGPYGRAVAALGTDDPLGTLNGPKTARFARNISGDDSAVTVDAWAARAVGADPDRLTPQRYAAVERAYVSAARARGVSPAVMQATVWVMARGRAA